METLEMSSCVAASPGEAWHWITSVQGISAELSPYLRMSVPRGIKSLSDLEMEPGKPLFRSIIYLLGVIPADFSRLTLLSIDEGVGFIEQSPMGSMRLWRHERVIQSLGAGCRVTDRLRFEPRFAPKLSSRLVKMLFTHRHAVLRKNLGGVSDMG